MTNVFIILGSIALIGGFLGILRAGEKDGICQYDNKHEYRKEGRR